jgi:hypothetical protein
MGKRRRGSLVGAWLWRTEQTEEQSCGQAVLGLWLRIEERAWDEVTKGNSSSRSRSAGVASGVAGLQQRYGAQERHVSRCMAQDGSVCLHGRGAGVHGPAKTSRRARGLGRQTRGVCTPEEVACDTWMGQTGGAHTLLGRRSDNVDTCFYSNNLCSKLPNSQK